MQNFVGKTKCIVGYMKVANGKRARQPRVAPIYLVQMERLRSERRGAAPTFFESESLTCGRENSLKMRSQKMHNNATGLQAMQKRSANSTTKLKRWEAKFLARNLSVRLLSYLELLLKFSISDLNKGVVPRSKAT